MVENFRRCCHQVHPLRGHLLPADHNLSGQRFLYNFLQLEGTKEDCNKYWASITVASFNPYTASQVCQTVRPTPLDLHHRDNLQSIGEAIVMTEK